MVTVISVTVTDDPASLIEHFDPVEVAPGDAGILVALAMTNGEDEAFRPAFAFGWRLVDAGGTERLMPYGTCGDAATDWLASGNIRRDRTATITVCWTLPPTLLDGALMEMRYAAGAGRYDPFSIEPPSAATPVALPAAQRETHRAGAGHPAPGFNPPLSSPV
jgi:hypothetical protein